MKDNIFIIWSGTNDIALKIKKILETKNYRCTIGGNSDNNSSFSSVGDTVIQQMKSCNQAIAIFQNKKDGTVSNNLFFELGFTLSKYRQTKVHCVRRMNETVVLPSDFDNSFVQPIECSNDDEFVNGIIDYFFTRQKMSINVNKMFLINNRHIIRENIQRHYSEKGSRCSDYELAQYILFYMQAAQMFGDELAVCNELKQFKTNYQVSFSEELLLSVNMAITFLETMVNIQGGENGVFFIDRRTFRQFEKRYMQYRSEIMEDDTGTFDEWADAFLSEHFSYIYNLYANSPDLTAEQKTKNIIKSKEWGELSLKDLEKLSIAAHVKDNNDHKGLVSLLYAYSYRNLFLDYRYLGDKEKELEYLEKTKIERTSLKTTFEGGGIDSQLYANFEMEYYLMLAEYINYADDFGLDEDEVEDDKAEIRDYIKRTNVYADVSRYIRRIEYLINQH